MTYLDLSPASAVSAKKGLRAWAARIRSENDTGEATLLCEIGRPERFALVETWAERARLDARHAGVHPEPSLAAGLAAPPDERIGEPFSIGAGRPAGPRALYVLVHIDVVPFNLAAVGEWLLAHAETSRTARGALRYEIWRQVDRPNHFTAIQAWADRAAYTSHVENAGTRAFRASLLAVKGALYDERLYLRVK